MIMDKEKVIYRDEFVKEIWENSQIFCKEEVVDAPQYVEVDKIFEIVEKYKDKEIERLNNDFVTLKLLQQEHLKEIERLRKREKKWEKWTTEKEILSTKMSEYLCKWKNIKREYKNQVENNRLKKQEIERLSKEVDMWNGLYNIEFDKARKYKSSNEKAIEYIKNTNFWGIYEDVPMNEVKYGDELLDILQGEDKDE